jgi:hypothetical protein
MDILPYEPDPTQDAAQGGLTCDLCGWRGPLAAFVVSLEDYGELLPPGCRLVPPTGFARCADARACDARLAGEQAADRGDLYVPWTDDDLPF